MQESNKGDPPKDTRFDLSIGPECEARILSITENIRLLADDRPLAAMKLCRDLQHELYSIEKQAAFRANERFKVSWAKIARTFGKDPHWAWDRFVASGLSHPKSRRKN